MELCSQKASSCAAHSISIDRIGFGYPGHRPLFQDFSCDFFPGITTILGSSGCGKTTLLRLIARRLTANSGRILGIQDRRIAWMGQTGGLLPWASVERNLLLGAQLRGERPDSSRANDLLGRMGLTGAAGMRPGELSGGMQQRTALARTLMEDADIILLDEPFAHLDAQTKRQLYELTSRELTGRIVVLVTHDPFEAIALSDRLIVLSGSPAQIAVDHDFRRPGLRDARDPAFDPIYRQVMAALGAP